MVEQKNKKALVSDDWTAIQPGTAYIYMREEFLACLSHCYFEFLSFIVKFCSNIDTQKITDC